MKKEIGGFFELELNSGKELHEKAVKLNSGRNALKFILQQRSYSTFFLPEYICSSALEPFQEMNLHYDFYPIDRCLRPMFRRDLQINEALLYVNYFGICDSYVASLAEYHHNLIVDNSQAFFSEPINGVDTFYSPRKFFGVPDGGYAYTNQSESVMLERDLSSDRCGHLLDRIDVGANESYQKYLANESSFSKLRMSKMSRLTEKLLSNINYVRVKETRRNNFLFLHHYLHRINELPVHLNDESTPMIYPFLFHSPHLRSFLIEHDVFVAQYWPDVTARVNESSDACYLASHLIALPIDQRYTLDDMKIMIDLIRDCGLKV